MTSPSDRLHALIEPIVTARDMDLEDIALSGSGDDRVLEVTVDKHGEFGVDEIAEVSRAVSRELDRSDSEGAGLVGSRSYRLEITSRGAHSPLTKPRHWQRNLGRQVEVRTHDGERISARISDAGDSAAIIDAGGHERRLAYDEVSSAMIQVELKRKGA